MQRPSKTRVTLLALLLLAVAVAVLVWLRGRAVVPVPLEAPRPADVPSQREPSVADVSADEQQRASVADASTAFDEASAPLARSDRRTLHVILVDERGGWVPSGAFVQAYSDDGEWTGVDTLEPTSALQPEIFALHDIAPGRWWLRAFATGFEPAVREVDVSAGEGIQEIELELVSKPSLRILLLTPDGRPFPRDGRYFPDAVATRERPTANVRTRVGNAAPDVCGTRALPQDLMAPDACIGVLQSECEPPLWVSLLAGTHVIEAKRWEVGMRELTFVLDPTLFASMRASLRMRLVDATTLAPLTVAHVTMLTGVRHAIGGPAKAGVVDFPSLHPGFVSWTVHAEGYATQAQERTLAPGETLDLGDVAVDPVRASTLELSIDAPDGVGEIETNYFIASEPSGDTGFRPRSVAKSKPGELLELRLAPGRWHLSCSAARGAAAFRSRSITVDVDDKNQRVALRLEPVAKLRLRPGPSACTIELGNPLRASDYRARHELQPHPIALELPIGPWEVLVRRSDGTQRVLRVELPPEGASLELE